MSENQNLVEKFDRLIEQARQYISEKNKKNSIIKDIQTEAAGIQSEIITKRDEIRKLIGELTDTESDYELRQKLSNSANELEFMETHVLLLAERQWVDDMVLQELAKNAQQQVTEREKYVLRETRRIKEELIEIDSFYGIAEIVNQTWADQDIFQEFNRLDDVIRAIIQRMNETNQKGSATQLSKQPLKTLEHIRLNLFKSSAWTEEEIDRYKKERNREIRQHKVYTVGNRQPMTVYIAGGSEDLCRLLQYEYPLPVNVSIIWLDIMSTDNPEVLLTGLMEPYLLITATYFSDNPLFKQLTAIIKERKIKCVLLENCIPGLIYKEIEDHLNVPRIIPRSIQFAKSS